MTTNTCEEEFKKAHANAPKYSSGHRRLEEVKVRINKMGATIEAIIAITMGNRDVHPQESLGSCLAFERADWLRALPVEIATLLGGEILPAISALRRDGLPNCFVQRRLEQANNDAAALLVRCELIRQKLLLTVKDEYDAIRAGDSMLERLLRDTFDIAETPLFYAKCETA